MKVDKQKIQLSLKQRISLLINFFLKGLLIVIPFAVTVGIIKSIVIAIDQYFDVGVPAVGFFIVIISITLLGYLGSSIITRPLLSLLDDLLSRIPFVKIIYTSVKDFIEAFVGDKKKFNNPVLVQLTPGVFKPGFITQSDLSHLKLPGMVAVYMPLSYAISGDLVVVKKDLVIPFDGNATEVMKFIISGGVTHLDEVK